jgi:hypothetical protein
MALQSAASLATQQEVRQRLGTAIGELDHAVHTLRDAVFGRELAALHDRAAEAGLSIDVQPIPGGTRLAWQMPLT